MSDDEIIKRLKNTGIDMSKLPYTKNRICELVRKWWSKYVGGKICIPYQGSIEYYENVAAAAMTGNRALVNLFLNTGYKLSVNQNFEVERYLKGNFTNPSYGKW